jgi:hypothetical protein
MDGCLVIGCGPLEKVLDSFTTVHPIECRSGVGN